MTARAAWHLWHDGRSYEPGEEVLVDGAALERLVAAGAVLVTEPPALSVEPAPEPEVVAEPEPDAPKIKLRRGG